MKNTIEVFRYLCIKQPKWVYKWVVLKEKFPLMKEHYDILIQVKNELEKLNTDENDEYDFSKMEINDYFLEEFCRKELLQNLICYSCILQNEQIIDIIYSAIDSITVNEVAFISVLDIINQFMEHIKDKNCFLSSMKRIIDLLMNMSDDDLFEKHFIDVCGNNLIGKLLYPSLRNDASLLINASSLFFSLNSEYPFQIVYLIGFMFLLNNSEIIPYALKLCSKINLKQMESLLSTIIKTFENEISKTDPSIDIIEAFIEDIPHLFKPKISELKPFIDKIFLKYEQSSFTNIRLSNFICSLMNFLAPEKLEYEFLFPKDSKEIDFSFSYSITPNITETQNKDDELLLQPAPKNLKNMNDFWEIYEKHRRALSKIIENNGNMVSKMSFLSYFPELLSFEKRVSHFRKSIRYHSNEFLSIEVDRNKNLFNDSFVQLNNRTYDEWMGKISVDFKGENGIDAGGLTREWFTLIIKEIFDPNQSLFISTENNSYIPKKSPHKLDETEIELYRFVGKIIARALVEGIHVNAHLTPSFCRQILHRQIKLSDMEDYDVNIYNSLISICDTDVEPLNLYFAINYDENGEYKTIPLKENGNNINVTNSNKMEYISLYTNYHLRESICDQLTAFCEGFDFIIHPDDIRFFAPNELDLLICGIPEIDVQDLRENTEYLYPYNKNHPVIKLFFKAIEKWSNEQLAKLIMFFTGSSQVPINGFAEYKKNGKPIQIGPGGDKNRLCTAHTCFNQLCLPEYETENELNYKLAQCIQEFSYGLI
ncbi:hypothetical protein M9Y10_018951 [Tritrichomonas musculus]|uniref:HECT-type E3 ubiquitin transferase n=1 Tax=Tritrichomonas musculus TaxID=1915356 RepID=A0ABR2HJ42_9EUKA